MSGFFLVDDREDELKIIHDCFVRAGIPCLPINYINDDPDNITGIDHIDTSKLSPRVIVTDLNLSEGSLEPINLAGPIAELLGNLINSGPYILYFWSKNISKVEEVVKILESRFSDKIQLPIHWGTLDKIEFMTGKADLNDKVHTLLQECPIFNAIFDWENRVAYAAQQTTNSLFHITTPKSSVDKEYNHIQSLSDTLAVIGNEALGNKNAKDNPSIAIDMGLAPVLNDRLSLMESDPSFWKDAIPDIGKYKPLSEEAICNLNSFYHVERVAENYPKNCKGVFVELSRDVLGNAEQKLKFESKLGRDLDTIFVDEFISTRKQEDKSRAESRAFRNDAKENITLGFIELSADCDQAQRKTKLNKYVFAALVPIKFSELTIFESDGVTRERAHDGIYRCPSFELNGEYYILLITYRYQIGTIPTSTIGGANYVNKWFGAPLFRLKEQIMGDISFRCAQHATRPGIVAFH